MQSYQVYPIGFVRKENDKTYIKILPAYLSGLYKLEKISHAFIFWWIHENDNLEARKTRISIPRVVNAIYPPQEMGTFATRSPRRPNPIGLTLVKILKIDNDIIVVDDIDAFDGTPILDIKPYLPNGDRVDNHISLPPWFQHLLISRPPEK